MAIGDGKAFAVPDNHSNAMLVDAETETVTNIGPAQPNRFKGGYYVGNGKIVLVPYTSGNIAIFDLNTETYIPVGPVSTTSHNYGACIGEGLAVVFQRYSGEKTSQWLVDSVTNTVTAVITKLIDENPRPISVGVNKLLGVIRNGANRPFTVYDIDSEIEMNTPTVPNLQYVSFQYVGDNKAMSHGGFGNPYLIDIKKGTIQLLASVPTGYNDIAANYVGDDKVLILGQSDNLILFDILTGTKTTLNAVDGPANAINYRSGSFVGNGKIVLAPFAYNYFDLIDLGEGYRPATPMGEAAILSSYFNKL